jgi:hypothetical protein
MNHGHGSGLSQLRTVYHLGRGASSQRFATSTRHSGPDSTP